MSIELPEHLRTGPLAEAAAKALADANSMASASNSIPRVSLRGREFRFIEGGDEVFKARDGVDVIILGVEPDAGRMIKTWYKDGYKSGAKEPPTCQSDDGIAPSPWVTDKQAQMCSACPKNQFGSAVSPSGKQTKACRDSKRIWIKRADEAEKRPFSERTTYGLNVTVASLKAFSDYGRQLSGLGQGPAVCVTTLVMVDSEYPQLDFKLKAWLDADLAPQSLKLAADRPWKIQYKNAGLALSAPDASKSSLPSSLPGLPAHLQPKSEPEASAQGDQTVVDATPAAAKPVGNVDDVIGNW